MSVNLKNLVVQNLEKLYENSFEIIIGILKLIWNFYFSIMKLSPFFCPEKFHFLLIEGKFSRLIDQSKSIESRN